MAVSPDAGQPSSWLERRVINYAHQGGAWEGPSSTLYAIASALEAGATAIELDVHATADGKLVVGHDPTVDRTTEGAGRIAELPWQSVRALDNAYWWVPGADVTPGLDPERYPFRGRGPADRRFRIALLEEVLDEFPGVILNLDIKQTGPAVVPYEETLAALLRRHRSRRRRDRGLVPRRRHRRLLDVRSGDPDLSGHDGRGRLHAGRAGRGDPGTDAPRGPAGTGDLR